MKRKRFCATLITSVILTAALSGSPSVATAGVYENTLVTEESINGTIRSDCWWTPPTNAGVTIGNSGVSFTSESRKASRMITINKAYNFGDYGFEECFTANMEIKVVSVPDGGRFGFVFGLSAQMQNPAAGGENTTFMYFTTNDNGLQVGLSNYSGADKTETEILSSTVLTGTGKLNKKQFFNVKLKVMASGAVSIIVSQKDTEIFTYTNDEANCFAEGYLGFAQTEAGSVAYIKDINVDSYEAINPENSNILTHFERGVFNLNEFYTSNYSYASRQSYVKPEKGGMVFKNTRSAFLSTKMQYSNFDAELEIADLARNASYNEDGTMDTSITTGFSVSLSKNYSSTKDDDSIFKISFVPVGGGAARQSTKTQATLYFAGKAVETVSLPNDLHLWSSKVSNGASIMLKISYIDGNLKVSVKFAGGYNYYEIFSCAVDDPCEGYLQVISDVTEMTDGLCDNFKIATISIVNKDYSKRIVSVVNKDNTSLVYDYQYVDTWDKADLPFGGK